MSADRGVVAVLGLGIVGSRAAACLERAGWRVERWSRGRAGRDGVRASASEAVAEARWISLYLKDSPAVRAVVEEIDPRLGPRQTLLNHSTVDLATTRWLAEFCAERGCGFLDLPFTGSKDAAAAGKLVYYTAGDPDLVASAEDLLAASSRARLDCGTQPGMATVVKLATNLISACTVQALAESLAIATRHGVAGPVLLEAVAANACSSVLSGMKLPGMLAGDFEAHFSLSNMAKDSNYVRELAAECGLETPAIDAVSARMAERCDAGDAELDYSVLAKPYLDLS